MLLLEVIENQHDRIVCFIKQVHINREVLLDVVFSFDESAYLTLQLKLVLQIVVENKLVCDQAVDSALAGFGNDLLDCLGRRRADLGAVNVGQQIHN